jgi:hydroxymethylbilane synthase
MTIRIGSRGSKLALIQAHMVKEKLLAHNPKYQIEILPIETTGDKKKSCDLTKIGGKALFLKELQEALLAKTIDIAVHSLKDVPASIPDDLAIACVLERGDPRDAFLSRDGSSLSSIKQNAIIGTSSPRRAIQLLKYRPDLKIVPFRGNVDSRINKMLDGQVDATLLALSGIQRLGIKIQYEILNPNLMVSAVGQGVICTECLSNNESIKIILQNINHTTTEILINAERGFLETVGGTCKTPLGAYAEFAENDQIKLSCFLANDEGTISINRIFKGSLDQAYDLGKKAAREMLQEIK